MTDDGPRGDDESSDVEDAPVVKYLQKILLDAINPARPTCTSSPTKTTTASATASTAI